MAGFWGWGTTTSAAAESTRVAGWIGLSDDCVQAGIGWLGLLRLTLARSADPTKNSCHLLLTFAFLSDYAVSLFEDDCATTLSK